MREMLFNEKVNKVVFVIFLATIFVYGFMNRLIDSRDVFVIGAPICIYWMLQRKSSPFDLQFLFLFATFYLMAIYEFMTEPWMGYRYNVMVYAFIFPFTYLLGKMCIGESKYEYQKNTFVIMSVLTAGMFAQAFLDYMKKNITNPFNNIREVGWYAFWNDEYILKNEVEFYFYLIIAALFFAFIYRRKNRPFFVAVLFAQMFIIINSLIVRGRSAILLMVCIFTLMTLVYIFTNHVSNSIKTGISLFIVVVVIITVVGMFLVCFNAFGIRDIYNNSFLSRDGGILHNVRFTWEREGYRKIFTLQKGGWIVESNVLQGKLHNSWMEYGRNYDIIIYLLLMLFSVTSLIRGIITLFRNNTKCPILFWAVGAQLLYFLYFSVERMGFADRDWIILYVFISGIVGGLSEMQNIGEYEIMNCEVSYSQKSIADFGLIFLFIAYLGMAYIDWWHDLDRPVILYAVLPVIVYLLPSVIRNIKVNNILLISISICGFVAAIVTLSKGGPKILAFALSIMAISCLIGYVFYRLKCDKIIVAIATLLGFVIIFFKTIMDGRLVTIKEAINLTMTYECGSPWGAVGLTSSPINSSSNVWLNYSRDYGRLILILLFIFMCWTLIRFIELLRVKDNKWFDYAIIIAYVLFNGVFMISDTGYDFRILLYSYLIICGMINTELLISRRVALSVSTLLLE